MTAPAKVRQGLHLRRNPVVLKELRGRMRGTRAFGVLSIYLALMSGFTVMLYVLASSSRDMRGFTSGGEIGRNLFLGIIGMELFLVTFIAPAFTSSAITGEREHQTYDLLRTTLLPARAFVVGKLLSALAYIVLLLLAAIPLQSIAFLFGGVTETDLALAFAVLMVTAITLCALGLYFSARSARTLTATVNTNAAALIVTVGVPLVSLIGYLLLQPWLNSGGFNNLSIGVQLALLIMIGLLVVSNPLVAAAISYYILVTQQALFTFNVELLSNNNKTVLTLPSPWIVFSIIYLGLAVILLVLTARRVNRID